MHLPVSNIPEVVDWRRIRKASQGVCHDQQFLAILQVKWVRFLTGSENCFQHSDKLARHVGEGLHPHSIGLVQVVCP